MKISIIHPSRGRAEQAYNTALHWFNNSRGEYDYLLGDYEYILSIDKTDECLNDYKNLFSDFGKKTNTIIHVNNNKSAIEAINNSAKIAIGDLLIVISDDFSCPIGWNKYLENNLNGEEDYLVKTDDGIQPTLITLPIMDRVYYNRFGYIYHPDYVHMFSDQEMTAVGHMLGRVLPIDMEFKHNHYSVGGMVKDAINAKNDATWSQGQNLFNQRLKSNFGLKDSEIVKLYSEIVWR